MPDDPIAIARPVAEALERAWNTANGEAFGRCFTPDADFVDIRGEHHRGREAISRGHQAIFDSVYRGTTVRYEVLTARQMGETVLAHVRADLKGAEHVLPPNDGAMASMVLVKGDEGWEIAAFHNTLRVLRG